MIFCGQKRRCLFWPDLDKKSVQGSRVSLGCAVRSCPDENSLCLVSLPCHLWQVRGNRLDRPITWRGEAAYLWELEQRTVFTVCCLQSCPPSLLSGCSNPPSDGAGTVYVVCRWACLLCTNREELCILVYWCEKRGLLSFTIVRLEFSWVGRGQN